MKGTELSTEEILGSWAEHSRLEVEFRETTPVAWECRKMSGHFQRGDEGRLLTGGDIWILNAGWNFARCKWDKDIPWQESSLSHDKETKKCRGLQRPRYLPGTGDKVPLWPCI